jgi:glycosyltransferase involved in cell wall biosynthesis
MTNLSQFHTVPHYEPLATPVAIGDQKWPWNAVPVVSVACTTYNHEKYINQTIEGFLIQETIFPVEIIIHDDASTDGTAKIVRDYQLRYPNLIKTILQKKNQWQQGQKNLWTIIAAARSEFIAVCEGDDYWIHPLKLQRQVEFLRNHPEYPFCFHRVLVLNEETKDLRERDFGAPEGRAEFCIDDLLGHSNFVATASVMFRKPVPPVMPAWFRESPYGDLPLHLWNLSRTGDGLFGRLPERMAVYRQHQGGMYSGTLRMVRTNLAIRSRLAAGSNLRLSSRPAFRVGLARLYLDMYGIAREEWRLLTALKAACWMLTRAPGRSKARFIRSVAGGFGRAICRSLTCIGARARKTYQAATLAIRQ